MQDAIDDAIWGDVLYVEAGPTIHVESFVIPVNLTIQAAQPGCAAAVTSPTDRAKFQAEPGFATVAIRELATDVRLNSLVLADGAGYRAGNIDAVDPDNLILIITDSVIGGGFSVGGGGGILMDGGQLFLQDTTMINNDATSFGGAVSTETATVQLSGNTLISQSESGWGGGINVYAGDVVMLGTSRVVGGKATYDGGCINASNVTMKNDTLVRDCEAGRDGGAIQAYNEVKMLNNSVVEDSKAVDDGGLIHASDVQLYGTTRLSNGTAFGNGGLVYLTNSIAQSLHVAGPVGVGEIVLEGGRAMDGGGVYAAGTGSTVTLLDHVIVRGNMALGFGGGFFLSDVDFEATGNVTIGDLVEINHAVAGGGIYAEKESVVDLNGIEWDVDQFDQLRPDMGVHILSNGASHSGGGIELHASTLTAEWAVVHGNRAVGSATGGDGGGIAAFGGSDVDLQDSHVGENRARRQGGGLFAEDSFVTMQGPSGDSYCALFAKYDRHCSELRGNESGRPLVTTLGVGGGLFAGDGAIVDVSFTGIQYNGSHVAGAQIMVEEGADVVVVSSLIADTSSAWLSEDGVRAKGTLDLRWSTIGGRGASVSYEAGAGGQFHANTIWPDSGLGGFVGPGGIPGGCNVGLGVSAAIGPANLPTDPLFTSGTRGPYRIGVASPANNNCPTNSSSDLDFAVRGFPLADAGAFEAN